MSIVKGIPAMAGLIITAACVGMTPGQEAAKEPGRLGLKSTALSANQQVAETIAERLRGAVSFKQERVDIAFAEGVAELTGVVADTVQRDLVVRLVQGVPGVERVRDQMTLRHSGLVRVQAAQPVPPALAFGPAPGAVAPQEPLPVFQAPPGPNPAQQPPPLPPYAWPATAPYNNYSRVAYPEAYPYQSFPFIGPMYPYPKVPLGWRRVSLEWQDGFWWYSKGPTGHDWWRIRYW